jgi:hypothetical protein
MVLQRMPPRGCSMLSASAGVVRMKARRIALSRMTEWIQCEDPSSGPLSHLAQLWVSICAALAAAREAIERAEKVMQETAWPAPEDYDHV